MSPLNGAVARVVMKGWEGGRGGSVGWVGWGPVAVQARTAVNCNVGEKLLSGHSSPPNGATLSPPKGAPAAVVVRG